MISSTPTHPSQAIKEEPAISLRTVGIDLPGWPPDIEKNSALDFSGLLDGPAGKYGRLIVSHGKFAFENKPGQPVRFYGVNLSSGANFLDKESCHKLTDRLAASGYNSLRIHHHDKTLTAATGERATGLDPVEMDKLDYLFHCCKERGIYLTTDLFVSRMPQEVFAELGRPVKNWEEFKFLIHLLDDARKNWEDFSRNFLNHVNPYTGLAWKEDPALATLGMVNEDSIYHCYKNATPDVRAIYDRLFAAWLSRHHSAPAGTEKKTALLNLFLFETCRDSFDQMRKFIRSLGCQTLLTDQNHWSIIPMSLLRQPCDFVDDHFYWDHPEDFKLPSKLLNTSALSGLSSIFSGIFPGRCFGKPYTISEFNWVYPNQHRAESAVLTGAYAALQGWDGLYRYSYAHSSAAVGGHHPAGYFDIAADPVNSLSDRIGILLFLRGDVQSSRLQIAFAVSSGHMEEDHPVDTYPGQSWKLGFVGQIGTAVENEGNLELPPSTRAAISVNDELKLHLKESSIPILSLADDEKRMAALAELCDFGKGLLDLNGGEIRSSTGELALNENSGTFLIVTPRTEVMVFNREGVLKGARMSALNKSGPAVLCISAMDGPDLASSRRVLVMHLTDARHEDTEFGQNTVARWGISPRFVVTPGQTEITFQCAWPDPATVWALDLSGKRLEEISHRRTATGALSFTAETRTENSARFLYEIVQALPGAIPG